MKGINFDQAIIPQLQLAVRHFGAVSRTLSRSLAILLPAIAATSSSMHALTLKSFPAMAGLSNELTQLTYAAAPLGPVDQAVRSALVRQPNPEGYNFS